MASETKIKTEVLYESRGYIVIVKPVGILSEGEKDSVISILSAQTGNTYYCVHRLDRAVSGVMVYAKTKEYAAYLSQLIACGGFTKEYLAVVHGKGEKNAVLEDLLFKDSKTNKSYVVKKERRGVRKARLEYETLGVSDDLSLVKIKLDTGRSHQIRVQFSSRKMPLYGDGKYGGSDNCDIALFSHRITFADKNGEEKSFSAFPYAKEPWNRFKLDFSE